MSSSEESKDREEACLKLLRATKTDNEKLAALLLVPKLFSTSLADESFPTAPQPLDKDFQRELIQAIDFQFLKRMLLISERAAEDDVVNSHIHLTDDSVSLKCAALSVISHFTTCDVLTKTEVSQLVSCVETLLTAVSASCLNAGVKAGDRLETYHQLSGLCIQCLENFVRDQDNETVEGLLLPVIYRIVMKQSAKGEITEKIPVLVSQLLLTRGNSWLSANSKVAMSAVYLHVIKLSAEDSIDFELCETASRLVYELPRGVVPEKLQSLVVNVMGRLCDTLRNKLPSKQRQQALKLLTGLIQIRGIADLIKEKGSKAALLVIHLCSIDVRMTLEQDNNAKVVEESDTLSASFFALEQMIFYMAHEETTLALDSKEILQVHSALQGAVSAIIYFLTSCAAEEELEEVLFGVISACVRLLGAWTAEETESLLNKYTLLLPQLLPLCAKMLTRIDCVQFVIPGLSNLTTDTEDIVDVIIQNLDFMCSYVRHCCSLLPTHPEYGHILVNTCVVVLNSLMMPKVNLQHQPLQSLLDTTATETVNIVGVSKNVDCNMTMMVTGLAARRKLNELVEGEDTDVLKAVDGKHKAFYRLCVEYLLSITNEEKMATKDIPEIWLMGIQVLSDLMKQSSIIQHILTQEEHMRLALQLFDKHGSNVDAVFVLERLLLTMADQAGAKDIIAKLNKTKK